MKIYKCKFKNNIKLQRFIINEEKVYWFKNYQNDDEFYIDESNILNINKNRKRFSESEFQDDDIIIFFVDNYITYSKYSAFENTFKKEYKAAFDFEKNILRKEILKKIIK